MFDYFLVRTALDGNGSVTVFGDQVPESRDFGIPGDISSAAFWLVAAAAQRRGHLLIRDVGLNHTRTALLGVLLRMGAQVREAIERHRSGRTARNCRGHRFPAQGHCHSG